MAVAGFAAGQYIQTGQVCYVGSDGFLYLANGASSETASSVGIAIDTGHAGSLIRVNVDAISNDYSNLTPGTPHYLSVATSGLPVAYSGWLSEVNTLGDSAYLQFIGRAVSSSGIEVELSPPLYVQYPLI